VLQPDAIVVGPSLAGFTIPYIQARARVYLAALPPLERSEVNKAFVDDAEEAEPNAARVPFRQAVR
jgi:hypothetical protein